MQAAASTSSGATIAMSVMARSETAGAASAGSGQEHAAKSGDAKNGEWSFDMSPLVSNPSTEEAGRQQGVLGWGAAPRQRRTALQPRLGRPYSRLGLVCAVGILMVMLVCYSSFGPGRGFDRREMLIVSSVAEASSPAFN